MLFQKIYRHRLPAVLTLQEVKSLLAAMSGTSRLMAELIYGSGLRVMECCQLRVKDLDFEGNLIFVAAGKGGTERYTLLPDRIVSDLRKHLSKVKAIFDKDRAAGMGPVWLPVTLAEKYPAAGSEWGWQWVFPSNSLASDPIARVVRRQHLSDVMIQKAVRNAVGKAGLSQSASVQTLRHCFACHMLLRGTDVRQVQDYLGHAHIETTLLYNQVVKTLRASPQSPLDLL